MAAADISSDGAGTCGSALAPEVATHRWTPLMIAAKNGQADVVSRSVEISISQPQMDRVNEDGDTALVIAAREGHEEIVQLLLRAGADHELKNGKGELAVDVARSAGVKRALESGAARYDAMLQAVLKGAAPADSAPGIGGLLAGLPSGDGDVQAIIAMANQLSAGKTGGGCMAAADISSDGAGTGGSALAPEVATHRWTPLMIAAKNGQADVVSRSVEISISQPQMDRVNEDGDTALVIAAREGHQEIVELLLRAGADHELKNGKGELAVDVARSAGVKRALESGAARYDAMLQAVLKGAAPADSAPGIGGLLAGLPSGDGDVQAIIAMANQLSAGKTGGGCMAAADISSDGAGTGGSALAPEVATHRWTPLMIAAKNGQADVVSRSVEISISQPQMDRVNEDGDTALVIAAREGHQEIVELLLRAGADHELKNGKGELAVDVARSAGVKRALESGAARYDAMLQAVLKGAAPADSAPGIGGLLAGLPSGDGDLQAIIAMANQLSAGKTGGGCMAATDISSDGAGTGGSALAPEVATHRWTPLMIAAKNGQADVVSRSVEISISQPQMDRVNEDGDTALVIAAREGHQEIVELLLRAGADHELKNGKGELAVDVARSAGVKRALESGAARYDAMLQAVLKGAAPADSAPGIGGLLAGLPSGDGDVQAIIAMANQLSAGKTVGGECPF